MEKNTFHEGNRLTFLKIVDLSTEGGAIAKHSNGKVIFLDRGVPGQTVHATIIKNMKKSCRAIVNEVVQFSNNEITPWCAYAMECGGCSWQNISSKAILEWKQNYVEQTLLRIGNISGVTISPIVSSPKSKNFRSKVVYAFGKTSEGIFEIGLRKKFSHTIVPVKECGLQASFVGDILSFIRANAQNSFVWNDMSNYLRFLVIHTPLYKVMDKRQVVIECITSNDYKKSYAGMVSKLLVKLFQELEKKGFSAGVVHSERKSKTDIAQGEKVLFTKGVTELLEEYRGKSFLFPYNSFMQTNTAVADLLYARVDDCAKVKKGDHIWDLYCGVGPIGLAIEKDCTIIGIDSQKDAINFAIKNGKNFQKSTKYYSNDNIKKILQHEQKKPDVIIVDPPRAGLSTDIVTFLDKSEAKKIIYISCDVATQARDIKKFSSAWNISGIYPFDMFPYTPHIENIITLERS